MLSNLFAGKSFQDRAVLLNRIFATGLRLAVADAYSLLVEHSGGLRDQEFEPR